MKHLTVGMTDEQLSSNVISLEVVRRQRGLLQDDPSYHTKITRMNKFELLEEMARYHESKSGLIDPPLEVLVRGRILFRALELTAETNELQMLASSYRRQLEHEINQRQRAP